MSGPPWWMRVLFKGERGFSAAFLIMRRILRGTEQVTVLQSAKLRGLPCA